MTLGKPTTVRADHQRDVKPAWRGVPQRLVEQKLARGAGQKIVAAEHLVDARSDVVDDDSK